MADPKTLTPEQQAKILQKKISSLYKEIVAIHDLAKAAEQDVKIFPAFRGRFRELDKLHNEFTKNWDELYVIYVVLEKEKDFPLEDKCLEKLKSFVYGCNTVFETIMNPIPEKPEKLDHANSVLNTGINISDTSHNSSSVRLRLPKISIPSFNGELLEWPKFRDVYLTLVHEEPALANIERFHYLIANLSGEPLRIVTSFSITDANYDSAWGSLKDRYDNKRVLAAAYLHKIRQFKSHSPTSANSAAQLRSFLKVVADSFTALSGLKIPDEADYFKLQLALDCLDPEVRKLFEEKQYGQEFPKYDSLISFVQQRCQVLELSESELPVQTKSKTYPAARYKSFNAFVQRESSPGYSTKRSVQSTCPYCKGDHPLFKCLNFKSLKIEQRYKFVRDKNLCINCLRTGHFVRKCKSASTCFHCKAKHHTSLHESKSVRSALTKTDTCMAGEPDSEVEPTGGPEEAQGIQGVVGATWGSTEVVLGTAMANALDGWGGWQPIRLVIDSGSQFSIITMDCARRLGLPYSPSRYSLSGLGKTKLPNVKGVINSKIRPIGNEKETVEVKALVVTSLIPELPTRSLPSSIASQFGSVKLADEKFWVPRSVDFLLGSDLFFQILDSEPKIKVSRSFGTLATIFGHVVLGAPPNSISNWPSKCLAIIESCPLSDSSLTRFWELENIQSNTYVHPDDREIEEHYRTNVRRLKSGRYMVALPLVDSQMSYPTSQSLSTTRFMKLESRLNQDPLLRDLYRDFMKEYVELGHMNISHKPPKYVIPHHAIFKPGLNDQPKLRVVFDASMKTSKGSLNGNLLPGPKLQQCVTTILLNFRTHRFVFCTDIVKMFRQILVVPEHRPFQTIIWRFSPEDALELYELNTLTYGETSSPYLAIRTVKQLIEDEGQSYPRAAEVLNRDIYVDDIISGDETLEGAIELRDQIIGLLSKGCFPVHKWASNSTKFLEGCSSTSLSKQVSLPPECESSKILGMHWDPTCDVFSFKLHSNFNSVQTTKRSMLSVIARLFDPLGLLAPVTLLAKALIQQLWIEKIDWDDVPPIHISRAWVNFIQDLPKVTRIVIPRWVKLSVGTLQLFGFCDASEKAYSAAVYIRVDEPSARVHSFLLTAKTRLAPVKTISIPKLELSAAFLLTKLLNSVQKSTLGKVAASNTLLFTDSTVVLSWLRLNPQQLQTFVANRVGYILEHTDVRQWHHVPSLQNPADIASRGALASSLIENELWWNGPEWMRKPTLVIPPMPAVMVDDVPEKKPTIVLMTLELGTIADSHIHRHSNYPLMIKSLAYAFRISSYWLEVIGRTTHKVVGPLTVDELQNATHYLIKDVQQRHFSNDFDYHSKRCKSSRFQSLMAFLDTDGLLRVGGRLARSSLPYTTKHPILLPHDSKLTMMIVDHHHKSNFHLGAKALQANLQRQYHIFRIRSIVRKRIWSCLRCFKLKARPDNPLMADLPLSRVAQGRPFISVGVDFAGPYSIKLSQRRNSSTTKAYLCVFICMAVKAVHLELVSSLSTEAFLLAFDRFVARRGLPSDIYSDCGTNFVGASRHLRELYEWINKEETLGRICSQGASRGVQWHFNPPSAPHFGGLWEAAVKSAKSHLRRTLGDKPFYFEELCTIFARIEAIMNSRPLCSVSEKPNDFDYLTPGHFLIGAPLTATPEHDVSDINISRLRRWQLLQASTQLFWRRWSNEYIHLLQARTKWTKSKPSMKVGDLALIQDTNSHPLHWKIGRIREVYPDHHGTIRIASVITSTGIVERPVHRLAALDPINASV